MTLGVFKMCHLTYVKSRVNM